MDTPSRDQTPEAWSEGASGYESSFASFTGAYADEVIERLGIGPGIRLLEVAAGSGEVTRRAADTGAEVFATDFSPGMVDLLARRCAEAGYDNVTTAVMDGQALDVDDDSFDAAIAMFGLMFFPDFDKGLRELERAVRPDGSVGVGVWKLDGFRLVELVGAALAAAIPDLPSPDGDPRWSPVGSVDGLAEHMRLTGLVDVETFETTRHWRWGDPAAFFRGLPDWSPPVQPLFEALPEATLEIAVDAFVELITAAGGTSDGPGIAIDAIVGIGRVAPT